MGLPIAHPYKLWLQCYTDYGSKNKFNSSMLARWSIIMSIRNIKRHWACLCLDWLFGGWYCFSASKGNFLTFGLALWIQIIRSGNFWNQGCCFWNFCESQESGSESKQTHYWQSVAGNHKKYQLASPRTTIGACIYITIIQSVLKWSYILNFTNYI